MADNSELFKIVDRTSEFEEKDAQDNKMMGIFAYLFLLVLIPIFAAKESKYARFHANQGLVLAIIEAGVSITMSVLGWIPVLGWIVNILGWLLNVGCVVLAVLGIVSVAKGQAKDLPIISKFKILK